MSLNLESFIGSFLGPDTRSAVGQAEKALGEQNTMPVEIRLIEYHVEILIYHPTIHSITVYPYITTGVLMMDNMHHRLEQAYSHFHHRFLCP